MVGAWLLIGLPVIASRIWWSVPAAIAVFVLTLSAYVTFAVRYMRRHSQPA
jgi:formate-dependent nitrite reductase membrane component NrfD